jgi:hypothetical protein
MASIIGLSLLMAGARRPDPPQESAASKPSEPPRAEPRDDDGPLVILGKGVVTLFAAYDASGRIAEDSLTGLLTPEQRKQKDEGDALIRQLDAMRQSRKGDRREALRQKVEQIKAQLQMLRMLAAIDPQAAARQAAQLSRELARAAKAYAAAGADAGAPANVAAPASGEPAASGESEAPVADMAASIAMPDEAPAAAHAQAGAGQDAEDQPEQQAAADGAKPAAGGSGAPSEDEAISDARKVARQLKLIIQQARQEALRRRESDDGIARDDAAVKDALGDIDEAGRDLQAQAVTDLQPALPPLAVAAVSVSILV